VTRRLAHEPFGWRPATLLVTVRRYRCTGCGHVWRQDTSRAAEPRAKLSQRGLRWALLDAGAGVDGIRMLKRLAERDIRRAAASGDEAALAEEALRILYQRKAFGEETGTSEEHYPQRKPPPPPPRPHHGGRAAREAAAGWPARGLVQRTAWSPNACRRGAAAF